MEQFVSGFYICLILQVILLLKAGAIPEQSTNTSITSNEELNSWDVPHSGAVCAPGWTLYQPTMKCFRSFQSAFVQQSALDFCTTTSSELATVSQSELYYLCGITSLSSGSPQTWWMGYEMHWAKGNSTDWELVDLSGSGDDLSWLGLKPPEGVAEEGTKLCVVVTLQSDQTTSWQLQSCTEKSGFLCAKDAQMVCFDRKGNEVWEGERYVPPGNDACTRCHCVGGKPEMCLTTMCAKPPCELYRLDPEECCVYICSDGGNEDDNSNLEVSDNMRWVLTMLTSFILLGMMLFMVYRMRQKRIAYLRYRAQQMREGHVMDFEPGTGPPPPPNLDDIDGAVYREPPPPYSFLKDDHIPTEQPPPYISTVALPMDVNPNRDRRSVFQQDSDAVALLEGSVSSEPNTPTLVTGVPAILPSPPAYTSSTDNSTVSSPQTEQSTPGGASSATTTPTQQTILPSVNTTV